MENASKALLMAGGMILAILILSLLIYGWNLFSEYQSSNDKLADIENTSQFNQHFTNYDRDDVQGYELISLVNRVVDYNERRTTDSQRGNNTNSIPIEITIKINQAEVFAFEELPKLIKNTTYTDNDETSKIRNGAISSFENNVTNKLNECLRNQNLDESRANKVAKNIGSIFLTESEIEDKSQRYNRK